MCALSPSIFGNNFSGIEKVVNTFSILKKIFSNMGGFRAHISRTLQRKRDKKDRDL